MRVPSSIVRLLLTVSFLMSTAVAQTPAPGAPSENAEQAFIIEKMITRDVFNTDGTGTRTSEMRIRVLSPAGVQGLGQLAFGYNSDSEQLAIDYVRVRKPNGQVVPTSIENAPEASLQFSQGAPVYTDYRQKNISVAALSPGSTLEYKATTRLLHSLAKNHFWLSHSFNKQAQVEDEELIVEVPNTREVKIKSGETYATEQTLSTRIYTWKSSNLSSANSEATTGSKAGKTKAEQDESTVPDVQLSTFHSWQEVAAWYQGLLEGRVSPTPELKTKMQELIQGAKTNEEKARRLYAFVSQNVRYVSLSFGIGRYQPHSAAEVLKNGYGDCKDKHALLSALLLSAGIASHAVLIHSRNDLDPDVPAPSQFDHVITVVDLEGKRVWLDPTIGIAPFGLIGPLLRDKQALLVSPDISDPLVRTPEVPPTAASETSVLEGRFDNAGNLEADIVTSMDGDQALPLRIAARQTSQAEWKDLVQQFSYYAGFAGDVTNVKIENVESPDVALKLSYHYSRKGYFAGDEKDKTVGRNTLPLPRVAPASDEIKQLKKKSQFKLGGPLQVTQKVKLHFTQEQHPTVPITISVSRDYASYGSVYALTGNDMSGERTYTVKNASIPVSRERDLQAFLAAITQDATQQLTVKLSPEAVNASSEDSNDAIKLNDAARARLNVNDYKGAEEFALKATQVDPQSLYAWNNLGLAYLGEGSHLDKAEAAFRKQIEINAYDEYAYNNLGQLLLKLQRKDEAVAAYRKQIEIVPLDKYAHKNLGIALAAMSKNAEAITELEKATQITPDDVMVKAMLAELYKNAGQKEKAQAMVAKLPPNIGAALSGRDIYSSLMIEDADPEASLQQTREYLQHMEESFSQNEAGDRGSGTSNVVAILWGRMGWAYFRQNRFPEAERYLNAAWTMSQSASVALRLGQVYEKENKKALAIRTYAEGTAGEGNREGTRESLLRLVTHASEADTATSGVRSRLTQNRTVVLNRKPAKPASANLLLVFAGSPFPEKVVFTEGTPDVVSRNEATIKAQKFPILYPDETPQHIVRSGLIYCGATGCSVVLIPPSTRSSSTEIPSLASHKKD
jgi:tetratricopeptide (TPR) repeat protein